MSATLPYALVSSILACWFPEGVSAVSDRLPGGELNDIFRVDADGQVYALRIYTRTTTRELVSEEQKVVQQLAERLPEVLPSIATPTGDLCGSSARVLVDRWI